MADPTDVDRPQGSHMSDDEIDAFLAERGDGVLALADGSDAYAVPIEEATGLQGGGYA